MQILAATSSRRLVFACGFFGRKTGDLGLIRAGGGGVSNGDGLLQLVHLPSALFCWYLGPVGPEIALFGGADGRGPTLFSDRACAWYLGHVVGGVGGSYRLEISSLAGLVLGASVGCSIRTRFFCLFSLSESWEVDFARPQVGPIGTSPISFP